MNTSKMPEIYPPEYEKEIQNEVTKIDWSDVEDYEMCESCKKALATTCYYAPICQKCMKRFFYENYEITRPKFDIL